MELAGLHTRYKQPELTSPSQWGLDVLSAEHIIRWEEENCRILPEALRRTCMGLFGGAVHLDEDSYCFLTKTTNLISNFITLESLFKSKKNVNIECTLSGMQYCINFLKPDSGATITDPQYAKLVHPNLGQAIILQHYTNHNPGASYLSSDYLSVLIDYGPMSQHVIGLADSIKDSAQCTVRNEGPLGL